MKGRTYRLLDPQELLQLLVEKNEINRNISFYYLQAV